MRRFRFTLTLATAALTTAALHTPVQADTYRWVDANGVVNYAEKLPRGIPSDQVTRISDSGKTTSRAPAAPQTAVTSQPTPSSRAISNERRKQNLTPEQQQMLERLEQAELDRQASMAQIRQQNCQRSQEVLANLSSKDKIRVNMPDGTQRALGEDERQERIKMAQQGIVDNCDA